MLECDRLRGTAIFARLLLASLQLSVVSCAGQQDSYERRAAAGSAVTAAEIARLTEELEAGHLGSEEARRLARLRVAAASRSDADFEARWARTAELIADVERRLDLMEAGEEAGRWPESPWLTAWSLARSPVSRELFRRVAIDQYQQSLGTGMDSVTRAALWAALSPRFRRNTLANAAWLEETLERIGWFSISEYGEDASEAAWLLVQHADHDPGFQASVLRRLTSIVSEGNVDRSHYAYLVDRVARNAGAPQIYGTQGQCIAGAWTPHVISNPEEVDTRRREMGLEPYEAYLNSMRCF